MSKLTQRQDALATETMNQVRILRSKLKSSMNDKEEKIEQMIKDEIFVYERELKTSKRNERKVVRTKVPVHQLRTLRRKLKTQDLISDYKDFNREMQETCFRILDELFPTEGIESKLSHLDLSIIAYKGGKTDGALECLRLLGDKLFKSKEVTLKNGNKILFEGLEGTTESTIAQWIDNLPILGDLIEGLELQEAGTEIEIEMKNESALDPKVFNEMKFIRNQQDSEGNCDLLYHMFVNEYKKL